ncbi:MAG: amidohydrolase, partial [Gammaproteobacteria bacterium]
MKYVFVALTIVLSTLPLSADRIRIDELANDIEADVIKWRHHLHQYPELSNREFKTAKYVADYLKSLGLEVTTEVAKTGV